MSSTKPKKPTGAFSTAMASKIAPKPSKSTKRKNNESDARKFKKPKLDKPKVYIGNPQSYGEESKDLSKKELRELAKRMADARKKKRNSNYDLEKELVSLWEKMRNRETLPDDRSLIVTEALNKMKGEIPKIAVSHVSSRVLQTCLKYCSEKEREAVFTELQPHILTLASNSYSVYLVKKMLDRASKEQLAACISSLRGHVAHLLRQATGSVVVENAYHFGTAAQKQELLGELYSTELKLFRGLTTTNEKTVVDIIAKLRLKKPAVIRHMNGVIQPVLEKGIVDHSIIHKLIIEFFTIADKASATFVMQLLTGSLLMRMLDTRDGCRIAVLCIKHGSAKDRKKIIREMKDIVGKIASSQFGSMVIACIFSVVDDTKLLTKFIVREIEKNLKNLVLEKNGRRILLQLLHPNCSRYLSLDDFASLDLTVPSLCLTDKSETSLSKAMDSDDKESAEEAKDVEEDAVTETTVVGGKKDPFLRRKELLVNSSLAESLIDVCVENAEEFLKSNFGKEVVYEVAVGGFDGILLPSLSEKLSELYEAIASVAAKPKPQEPEKKSEPKSKEAKKKSKSKPLETENKSKSKPLETEKKSEHILEDFHSSRTIRRLVLDCPAFATILFNKALSGKCRSWSQGHCSKILSAFLESEDVQVREMATKELQVLVNEGVLKITEAKKTE